jgi:hypothetical protein
MQHCSISSAAAAEEIQNQKCLAHIAKKQQSFQRKITLFQRQFVLLKSFVWFIVITVHIIM